MALNELIRSAFQNDFLVLKESVKDFCQQEQVNFPAFSEQFARLVATNYHEGRFDWSDADTAMNNLHGVAAGHAYHTGEWLSDFADAVYLAFDAGEYHPATPHLSADEVTRPLVESLLFA